MKKDYFHKAQSYFGMTICLLFFQLYIDAQSHPGPFILDDLDTVNGEFHLRDSAVYYVDSFSVLNYDEILATEFQQKFQPLANHSIEFDNGCSGLFNDGCHTVWVKVRIKSTVPVLATFYYANYYWYGNYQTTYIQRSNDSLEILYAGHFNPESKQNKVQQRMGEFDDRLKICFPFQLNYNEEVTVYSKLYHFSTPVLVVNPRVWVESRMVQLNRNHIRTHQRAVFIQGMIWLLILYNLCIFLLNRQAAYFYFIGYNLCMAVILLYFGHLKGNVFTENPQYLFYVEVLALAALPGFYGALLYHFLDIPMSIPRLKQFFKIIIGFSFSLVLGTLLFFTISTNWYLADRICTIVIYFTLIPFLFFIFYALGQKKKQFYFFLVANVCLLLGGSSFIVQEYKLFYPWIDFNILDAIAFFEFSIIAEMLTFAAGLGYKSRHTEIEKIRLETTEKVKNRLYTNITHEFRTPLTVIMGMLDNIKGHENERRLIRRNSKNVLRLINQLLDLSKLDSGTMNLDLVQGNMVNYLRYLTESFESMAIEKKLTLTFESFSEELIMDFDEIKLQHVVYNLLSNAIKFTPKGAVNVSVKKRNMDGQAFMIFSVQDSGIGISEDQMPYIFDRFFQADQTNTRKGEGTGIGLALTREMVKIMGGKLEVESTLNVGSTFTVVLPVKQSENIARYNADQQKPWNPISNSVEEQDFDVEHTGIDLPRLLIIEDNKDVATYIRSLLQTEYQIEVAEDGQQGIDKAMATIPDIIISDVMMPEKDGFEVCQTLKTDMLTSHIPIILLTAKAEQRDKVEGLKHGADAYLMKPFDKAELVVRLQKLIEIRKTLQTKYGNISEQAANQKEEPSLDEKFLLELKGIVEKHMSQPDTTLENIYQDMRMSNMQLYRKLKALTGLTPTLFVREVRLRKAIELLKTSSLNVSEVAYEVGFNDPAYFSRVFNDKFGKPPSEFVKK